MDREGFLIRLILKKDTDLSTKSRLTSKSEDGS